MRCGSFWILFLSSMALSACSNAHQALYPIPQLPERDLNHCAEVENNEMDDFVSISIDTFGCRSLLTKNPEVVAVPRIILNKKSKKFLYQVYVFVGAKDWYFLHSYRYIFRGKLEDTHALTRIDRSVNSVGVREDYVFPLVQDRYQFFTENDIRVRVYGKRGDVTVDVPATLFKQVQEAAESERSKLK